MTPDLVRVALIWPGTGRETAKSFGSPSLLALASAVLATKVASVSIYDLGSRLDASVSNWEYLKRQRFDIIGLSCYSSYDYLVVMAIATWLRSCHPKAWLVVGGYHPSALPEDFTQPDSPLHYVVVGEGEQPLSELVLSRARGESPTEGVLLGPPSTPLPTRPYPYALLGTPRADREDLLVDINLSRGCPFSCSFCMERTKDVTFRSLPVGQALEELHRLDHYLGERPYLLRITDPLFGLDHSWRRELLSGLARDPIGARRLWVLSRIDLLTVEDVALMSRARCSFGVGLETADPELLSSVHKTRVAPAEFLERFLGLAEAAQRFDVPFAANLILGLPGESQATLSRTAEYLGQLFKHQATCGIVSVDRFRLYPGSPIYRNLPAYQEKTGLRVHRPKWWHDGDMAFLSEWIDPSSELSYADATLLGHRTCAPLLSGLADRFSHHGPSRRRFVETMRQSASAWQTPSIFRQLSQLQLWQKLVYRKPCDYGLLREPAHSVREQSVLRLEAHRGSLPLPEDRTVEKSVYRALIEVARERFAPISELEHTATDQVVRLTGDGLSTISALHAYLLSFCWLQIGPGDRVADLGGGTGYGAALLATLVGEQGRVITVEAVKELSARAAELLVDIPQVRVVCGDARDVSLFSGVTKITVGFAVPTLPTALMDALPVGGKMVIPVGKEHQRLTLVERHANGLVTRDITEVVFVPCRERTETPTWQATVDAPRQGHAAQHDEPSEQH